MTIGRCTLVIRNPTDHVTCDVDHLGECQVIPSRVPYWHGGCIRCHQHTHRRAMRRQDPSALEVSFMVTNSLHRALTLTIGGLAACVLLSVPAAAQDHEAGHERAATRSGGGYVRHGPRERAYATPQPARELRRSPGASQRPACRRPHGRVGRSRHGAARRTVSSRPPVGTWALPRRVRSRPRVPVGRWWPGSVLVRRVLIQRCGSRRGLLQRLVMGRRLRRDLRRPGSSRVLPGVQSAARDLRTRGVSRQRLAARGIRPFVWCRPPVRRQRRSQSPGDSRDRAAPRRPVGPIDGPGEGPDARADSSSLRRTPMPRGFRVAIAAPLAGAPLCGPTERRIVARYRDHTNATDPGQHGPLEGIATGNGSWMVRRPCRCQRARGRLPDRGPHTEVGDDSDAKGIQGRPHRSSDPLDGHGPTSQREREGSSQQQSIVSYARAKDKARREMPVGRERDANLTRNAIRDGQARGPLRMAHPTAAAGPANQ